MSHPIIVLFEDAGLAEARRQFKKKRFRHIPIVNDKGILSGIISDRDILNLDAHEKETARDNLTLPDIMESQVLFGKPEAEVRNIAVILIKKKIGCMPIVSDAGKPLGIITRTDILRVFVGNSPLDLWI